jgi:hypothetical protein
VVILKARDPARIMTAVGDNKTNRWHLQIANRWGRDDLPERRTSMQRRKSSGTAGLALFP